MLEQEAIIDVATSEQQRSAESDPFPVPVVWLLGKVQTGKSSIIRALTGDDRAEIGDGFRACTRASMAYDFPRHEPIVRFLDTRGLGEVNYDPGADIDYCARRAHLLICTMRAMDHQQGAVLDVVRRIRISHPEWPVIVAQTTLHEGYGLRRSHVVPYPFPDANPELPAALVRSLSVQRRLFDAIRGPAPVFVPLDFTQPDDRLEPQAYGLDALKAALCVAAPLSISAALADAGANEGNASARKAHKVILGHAIAAAAGDVLPVVGMVAVPGIQARMLASLAAIYEVQWDRRSAAELAGALGTGTAARLVAAFGARELLKLVPVYGQTIGAASASAASFATTYALGKAAAYYLGRRHMGEFARDGVADAYRQAFAKAFGIARQHDPRMPPDNADTRK